MIKSTANTTVKSQSSDNNWDSVGGEQESRETKSAAKRLIRPIWLHREVDWAVVCTAEPKGENNDRTRGFEVGHCYGNQFRDET